MMKQQHTSIYYIMLLIMNILKYYLDIMYSTNRQCVLYIIQNANKKSTKCWTCSKPRWCSC